MNGNSYHGTLITLEGLDGCGKSTVQDKLADALAEDRVVGTTKEPTDTWTGDRVYEALERDELNALVDFFMFLADRAKHVDEVVEPALRRGEIVISDRYADSTRAYQTHRIAEILGWDHPTERWIEEVFRPWHIEADIVVFLDVSVRVSMKRCGMDDKYEKRENLREVYENYKRMFEDDPRVVRVNAEMPPDIVADEAIEKVRNVL